MSLDKPFMALIFMSALESVGTSQIPSSRRSVEAIARVQPGLKTALAGQALLFGSPIYIRIFKAERELELWVAKGEQFVLFRKYSICAFSGGLGPKLREGDQQSPEGFYSVSPGQMNPASSYHLSFDLGYPNQYDRAKGRTGSALMVHGKCVSIGCYAITDKFIEEIYAMADAAFRNGQPAFRVHVFPFRMTAEKLGKYKNSTWSSFWLELKAGYDLFEKLHRPPAVTVRNGRYVVTAN
jgi:murein L,D-transpeptidase YafK